MKKAFFIAMAVILVISLSACIVISAPTPTPSPTGTPASSEPPASTEPAASSEPTASAEPTPSVEPTPSAEPTPTPSAFTPDTPDKAGSGDTLFDIYASHALVDLNNDGTLEELVFEAGASSSRLYINGTEYTVNKSGLAQLFAVTDVDKSDNILELVFTDIYNSELADSEKAYSFLYWWDGTSLTLMGDLMDVKFDGAWRGAFNAADHFKADNFVLCLARTTEFTDVWYTGKYQPNGTARKLKEVLYATKPLNMPIDLSVKPGMACILLAHADSTFFGSAYYVIWDYASWPHIEGRAIAPTADIVIITLGPEPVKLVGVLGPNWFKLETADHYKGWVKVVDGKVQGYWHVMGYTADDIFDGIIIAG